MRAKIKFAKKIKFATSNAFVSNFSMRSYASLQQYVSQYVSQQYILFSSEVFTSYASQSFRLLYIRFAAKSFVYFQAEEYYTQSVEYYEVIDYLEAMKRKMSIKYKFDESVVKQSLNYYESLANFMSIMLSSIKINFMSSIYL